MSGVVPRATAASSWVGGVARANPFLTLSVVLAAASCVVVPPDAAYLDYFEPRTLMSLLCMLAVICALENVHFFSTAAELVLRVLRTRRSLVVGLVAVTLVGSMLITNDMALITFLPLAHLTLRSTGNERLLAFVFVLMTVAANLGGMITPFGSPQNLYLYQYFQLPLGEFARIMWLPFAVSTVLILGLCLTVRRGAAHAPVGFGAALPVRSTVLYLTLFALALAIALRALPVWSGIAVLVVLAVVDRAALAKVDYGLMATFVVFFVVVGNLARMAAVAGFLTELLSDHVLLWSALGSQVVSNVPAAIMFADFTTHHEELLVGVNIGGVGTTIASLASLITLRRFEAYSPGNLRTFLPTFFAVNFALLLVLVVVMQGAFTAGYL